MGFLEARSALSILCLGFSVDGVLGLSSCGKIGTGGNEGGAGGSELAEGLEESLAANGATGGSFSLGGESHIGSQAEVVRPEEGVSISA